MKNENGITVESIYTGPLDFIDVNYTNLNQTIRYEKRQRGEWRDYSDEGYVECPFCEHATNCDDNIEDLHFCFWCGARNERGG